MFEAVDSLRDCFPTPEMLRPESRVVRSYKLKTNEKLPEIEFHSLQADHFGDCFGDGGEPSVFATIVSFTKANDAR